MSLNVTTIRGRAYKTFVTKNIHLKICCFKPLYIGAHSKTVVIIGSELDYNSSILDETVSILHGVNTLGKCMSYW